MTDEGPLPRSLSELRARARGLAGQSTPAPVQTSALPVSRRVDGAVFDTAAREVIAAATAKTRILPANKMTRADESLCHFLTEGDLARTENASKFGGSSNLAALVYGALFGIAAPFIASGWKMHREGLATLGAADVISLFIGAVLIGGSLVVWKSSRRHETVQTVCKEYRERPQQDVE